MAFLNTAVGPIISGDNTNPIARATRDASLGTQDTHGRYQEAVLRGNCYAVANQSGVTSQAGLSATTPVLTLYNPTGSGISCVLLYAGGAITVAAATAGMVWLASNSVATAAVVTGTAAVPVNCALGNAKLSGAKPFTAATLPAAPIAIANLGVMLTGAITTVPALATFGREFAGSVILLPNSAVSIQTGVASGASGLFCEFIWEEVPYIA